MKATPRLRARDVLGVALAKAGISALVLASGFRAISDDDFARVVIAQRFAAEPALNPSGTSWLPLPFWIQGGVFLVFGRSLELARVTAFVLGVLAALLVLVAARWAGASRKGAVLGAIVAAAIPYAAWLGVATVPDFSTAALSVLGLGAVTRPELRPRLWGALALTAAALSRYEAWPIAGGFALLCAWDARHERRLLAPAALAIAGPLGWMLHGALTHGHALFFVSRVSAYKRAVGGAASTLSAVIDPPLAVLRCEPELVGATLVVLAASIAVGRAEALRRHARPLALLGLLTAFLITGELRASGATHHAERAVLTVWLWLGVLAADLGTRTWPELGRHGRLAAAATLLAAVGVAAAIVRPWYARRDDFVDRSAEVAIGRRAAELASPEDELLVDTPDFGFYAVMAGFARPERARALDDRDPRRAPRPDAFASEALLRDRIAGARWLVVHRDHLPLASRLGPLRHQTDGYALVGPR